MNLDDINKVLVLIATVGGIIKLSIDGISAIRKHEILTKYKYVLINSLSFLFVIAAAFSYYVSKSYKYAVILFFISWLIESGLFVFKNDRLTRYDIWMMIYQTGVLLLLVIIYFVMLIIKVFETI